MEMKRRNLRLGLKISLLMLSASLLARATRDRERFNSVEIEGPEREVGSYS